jgi:hypothetical protein
MTKNRAKRNEELHHRYKLTFGGVVPHLFSFAAGFAPKPMNFFAERTFLPLGGKFIPDFLLKQLKH